MVLFAPQSSGTLETGTCTELNTKSDTEKIRSIRQSGRVIEQRRGAYVVAVGAGGVLLRLV